jgi:hypothetical protein
MEVSSQLHAPALYIRGSSPQYPLYGPQSRSGRYVEGETSCAYRNQILTPQLCSPQPSRYADRAIPKIRR